MNSKIYGLLLVGSFSSALFADSGEGDVQFTNKSQQKIQVRLSCNEKDLNTGTGVYTQSLNSNDTTTIHASDLKNYCTNPDQDLYIQVTDQFDQEGKGSNYKSCLYSPNPKYTPTGSFYSFTINSNQDPAKPYVCNGGRVGKSNAGASKSGSKAAKN